MEFSFGWAKEDVVRLVESGVKSFIPGRWLGLVTDWSKTGVRYVLWQKWCGCPKIHPGWWSYVRVVSSAPLQNLSTIQLKGKGCQDLLVLVDHKLLIGLLENGGKFSTPVWKC